jgi:hypothetical protein
MKKNAWSSHKETWYIIETTDEFQVSDGLPGERSMSYDFSTTCHLLDVMNEVTAKRRKELGDKNACIAFRVYDEEEVR